MDWTVILIVLGFVALLAGRTVIGICFEGSWLNSALEWSSDGDGDSGCDGGDGGGD